MSRKRGAWHFDRDAFARIRQGQDLSMTELARRAGTYPSTISAWERGQSIPSIEQLGAVMAVLKEDIAQVVSFPDDNELTLRELRESRLFRRQEVADTLGVTVGSIGILERGISPLTEERVKALAKLYEVSPSLIRTAHLNTLYRMEEET